MAAKAHAILNGQVYVSCQDVATMAGPVLRHRIIPNFSATSEGLTPDDIIERILEEVPQDEKLS
jgi:MoxR-like ATPase